MTPTTGRARQADGVEHAPAMPAAVRGILLVGGLGIAVYSVWLLTGLNDVVPARDMWLYCLLFLPGIAVFTIRWRIRDSTSSAWGLFAASGVVWLVAEVLALTIGGGDAAGPPWVQFLFLLVVPLNYAGLVILIRRTAPDAAFDTYLDGLIIALAIVSALSLPQPWAGQTPLPVNLDTIISLSYPALDLLQIALIVGAMIMLGRATAGAWWWLLTGSLLVWFADSFWLLQLSLGASLDNSRVDMLWPLGLLLMSVAAWRDLRHGQAAEHRGWLLPLLVTAAAFSLIVAATVVPVPSFTVALATGAVVTGALRSVSAFRAASARAQAQLLARTDDLTGLANRRGLVDASPQILDSHQGLLLVDIDRFKQINDTLGHKAGDDVLRGVAQRFREVVPAGVLLARIGGDEFALLTGQGTTRQQATDLAAALHRSVSAPLRATGIELAVELSVGVAMAPEHGRTLSALLLSADRAMYRAKRDHISTQVFDPGWEGDEPGSLLLLQDLRAGLERGEFTCHYQPQLDVLLNEVVAVEALVRWEHPTHGLIPAGAFLQMVEQTTMIRPLTDAILNTALSQLRAWDELGFRLRLSVNVSATNLMDRALPVRVAQLLANHHIEAGRLTLEITETALSGDEDRVRTVLAQLHEIGVEISIDDYGSGYSSLHQIGTLGAQELKLDREFVTGVGDRSDLRSILAATVHLAHGLRLRMVAEGVESASDLDQVRLSGCDLAQGWHISPAREGDDLVLWLRERAQRVGDERLRY